MAAPKIDYDKASRALIDAQFIGDEAAAPQHGVTTRTIERWRARMPEDKQLSEAVGRRLRLIVQTKDDLWLKQVPHALEKLLGLVERITDENDPTWDDLGKAMSAISALADIALVRRVLDAKFGQAGEDHSDSGEVGQIVPHPSASGSG